MGQPLNTPPLDQCPVAWQAKQQPNNIAIQSEQQSLSFLELHWSIDNLTQQLLALNIKQGDRLVCIAKNSLTLILLQLACLRNGVIFCPLNPRFSAAELTQRITQLNSTFIWQETDCPSNEFNTLTLDINKAMQVAQQKKQKVALIKIDPFAIVDIIFTSGSSGVPKAVMHHFSNHYHSALGSQSLIPLNPGDQNLLSLPLFHISGYATVIRSILAAASLVISQKKLSITLLKKYKITHLSLVSTQLQQLLNNVNFQPTQLYLKHILLGGSAFSSQNLHEIRAREFTFHLSYGLTEMSSQVATSCNDEDLCVLPYRQVKIEKNEIYLRGETRFAGYFMGDSEKNRLADDVWFATKDLGKLKAQDLQIIGRKDRQFISGGENVQPEEIEKLLLSSPDVLQAHVLAVKDPLYGSRPIAFIKWKHHAEISRLKTYINNQLVTFKQPLNYLPLPPQSGVKADFNALQILADSTL